MQLSTTVFVCVVFCAEIIFICAKHTTLRYNEYLILCLTLFCEVLFLVYRVVSLPNDPWSAILWFLWFLFTVITFTITVVGIENQMQRASSTNVFHSGTQDAIVSLFCFVPSGLFCMYLADGWMQFYLCYFTEPLD